MTDTERQSRAGADMPAAKPGQNAASRGGAEGGQTKLFSRVSECRRKRMRRMKNEH